MASRSSVKPQVRPPEYKGCEVPRIFTPPLRELTEETSLGFMMIEFASAFQKSMVSKTWAALAQNWPPGRSGGKVEVSALLSLEPMMNDHHNG